MQLCNLPYNFLYFILSLSPVPWRCSLIFIFQNTLHFVNYILEITSKVSVILYLLCPLPFQIFLFFNSRYAYTHFSITYLIYVTFKIPIVQRVLFIGILSPVLSSIHVFSFFNIRHAVQGPIYFYFFQDFYFSQLFQLKAQRSNVPLPHISWHVQRGTKHCTKLLRMRRNDKMIVSTKILCTLRVCSRR